MPAYTKKPKGGNQAAGKKRPAREDSYDSDDGFVANGSDDNGPRKKTKTATKRNLPWKKDGKKDEEQFWELSDKRRVTISEYRGKQTIGIREYYEKDGEMLPGKKGISLSVAQYSTLVELLPEIEAGLIAKGENVPRPNYEGKPSPSLIANEISKEVAGGGEVGQETGKKNFEATSEEEE